MAQPSPSNHDHDHDHSHENNPMDIVREAKAKRAKMGSSAPLPVTVLSGFLGAGKTTTLKHILENKAGLKVAVIVNDMAEVNVDANLIEDQGALVQAEEKMVALQNGCICCTLREDLFVELAKLAGRSESLDHIIIESSGISEPLPVAETFTFTDETGTSLSELACLDTLVTVVDGASFLDELYAADALKSRGWGVSEEDERTVAQLFCDQLEFANVIIMNKMDLMDDAGRQRLRAILKRFNPGAKLVEATWGRVDPKSILGTGLFDLSKAEQHPEWLKEARIGEHTPESVEYGISSITFRSRRPFEMKRFKDLTEVMETRLKLVSHSNEQKTEEDAPPPPPPQNDSSVSESSRRAAMRVVRSKGLVWIAHPQSHWHQGTASLAGRTFSVNYGDPWAAATDSRADGRGSLLEPSDGVGPPPSPFWEAPWGDRRTELVVIGQNMDHSAMNAALEACLMTDREMSSYTDHFREAVPPWAEAAAKERARREEQRMLDVAEKTFRQKLAIDEKTHGPEHAETAGAMNNLALVLQDKGQGAEAEAMFRRVLVVFEREFGSEDENTARTLNNLAMLLKDKGEHDEAEEKFRRVLAIFEKNQASDLEAIASVVNNLALVLEYKRSLDDAIVMYRRLLEIKEKIHSPNHIGTADFVLSLGRVLQDAEQLEESETMFRRVLAIYEKEYGPEHIDTAKTYNNLGLLLEDKLQHEEAEIMYRRAIAIKEKIHGPEHPSTSNTNNNLAMVLHARGQLDEAEKLLRGVLLLRSKLYGPDHSFTAITHAHLARVLLDKRQFDEAIVLFHRALVNNDKDGSDPPYSVYLQGCIGAVAMLKGLSDAPSGTEGTDGRGAVEKAITELTSPPHSEVGFDKQKNIDVFVKRLRQYLQ